MNLLDLINSETGKTLIQGTSKQIGESPDKTASALSAALPLILGGMKNNAKSTDGASSLLNALSGNKHDGSIINNLGSILGGGGIDNDVLQDGAGILNHVFKGKEQNVAGAVSKSSGIDMGSAMKILQVAAPFVMSYLGKETTQQNISDQNGVNNLLGGLLGSNSSQEQSMVERLLDSDGDGSIIDDVAGMIMGSGKKSGGGLGSLLGGLFK
ncbi:MAG: hypothetical protein CSA39_04540 [Flavobacteriales bacterium]|nr:MAG: hypothetical protein CSA39_04540 [Flavobacteriales bacterium]